ncbi:MAG: cytochrome c [Pseudomonadota bacterium]|nr:cytochrome c [Pseudomonadota bacterium]
MPDQQGQYKATFVRSLLYVGLLLLSQAVYAIQATSTELPQQRRAELHNLLLQDCGSCHGMTLKGGLGPALTPDALADKPREFIEHTIREGRSGTPMPPWKNILTRDEIHWLVDTLYSGIATGTTP